MTHKQVWTEIAEAFLTAESEGTKRQVDLASRGLCYAKEGMVPTTSGGKRICHFLCSLSGHADWFWFDNRWKLTHRREYDLVRGDFAILMACITEKELGELLAGTPAQQKETL